jgi:hypothetical protein
LSFIDVRRRVASIPSASARRPIPVYTAASRISNVAKSATMNGSALGPGGSARTIRSAGA